MYNIVLAAGNSKRFADVGYKKPKFLLKVKNSLMLVKAANSIKNNDNLIFVMQKKHLAKNPEIKNIIKKKFSNSKIIEIKNVTNGQATSLMKVKNFVTLNDKIFVTASDMEFSYDKKIFREFLREKKNIVFTTKPTVFMKKNPNQFGWISHNKKGVIKKVSIKKEIKNSKQEKTVIIGSFFFFKFSNFCNHYKNLLKKNRKINNEFYIDSIIESMSIDDTVRCLKVKNYTSWGTPIEYEKRR
tara:strand:+ start:3797 stop:4522 length:726 start_codon:yes stop_codon:yes gene_type:complete